MWLDVVVVVLADVVVVVVTKQKMIEIGESDERMVGWWWKLNQK